MPFFVELVIFTGCIQNDLTNKSLHSDSPFHMIADIKEFSLLFYCLELYK